MIKLLNLIKRRPTCTGRGFVRAHTVTNAQKELNVNLMISQRCLQERITVYVINKPNCYVPLNVTDMVPVSFRSNWLQV